MRGMRNRGGTRRRGRIRALSAVVTLGSVVGLVATACAPPTGAGGWQVPTAQSVGHVDLGITGWAPTGERIGPVGAQLTLAFPLGDGIGVLDLEHFRFRGVGPDGGVRVLPTAGLDGRVGRAVGLPLTISHAPLAGGRTAVSMGDRIAAFLPDGTLDPDWGDDGILTLPPTVAPPFGGGDPVAHPRRITDLDAGPDGGLAVGSVSDQRILTTSKDVLGTVTVLDADGNPDTTFGTDGAVDLGALAGRVARPGVKVAWTPTGHLVVGWGQANSATVIRLDAEGAVDPVVPAIVTTFGGGCPDCDMQLADLEVDELGRVLVLTSTEILRTLPDGTLDPAFSGDGRLERTNPGQLPCVGPLERRPALGDTLVHCPSVGIARLLEDGTLDTAFAVPNVQPVDPTTLGYRAHDWTPGPGAFCCYPVRNGPLYLVGSSGFLDGNLFVLRSREP